jgi:hypothetical protein
MAPVLTRPRGTPSNEAPPPPAIDPDEGGGGGEWALLTVAANEVLAHLIRGRLALEGIDVVLDSSNASPGAWLHPFGDPSSPVRIFVRRSDLPAASLLLLEVEQPPPVARGRAPGPLRTADRGRLGAKRRRWPLLALRLLVAALAAVAVSGLLVFGPCVSHWFCV